MTPELRITFKVVQEQDTGTMATIGGCEHTDLEWRNEQVVCFGCGLRWTVRVANISWRGTTP